MKIRKDINWIQQIFWIIIKIKKLVNWTQANCLLYRFFLLKNNQNPNKFMIQPKGFLFGSTVLWPFSLVPKVQPKSTNRKAQNISKFYNFSFEPGSSNFLESALRFGKYDWKSGLSGTGKGIKRWLPTLLLPKQESGKKSVTKNEQNQTFHRRKKEIPSFNQWKNKKKLQVKFNTLETRDREKETFNR